MADLVLGLAKSAVEGTLAMAKSAIEEEKKLQKSVKRDLMLISDEFEMMHSFLNVTKERVTDDMARTVVRQVRNMALDAEDCIESVVYLDNKSNWWRRLFPSCIPASVPAVALDDAVVGIELLKARVEAMGQRNMRYSHICDSNSKPPEQKYRQPMANSTALDILVDARDSLKKQSGPQDLVELINRKDGVCEHQVISVWGTAGDLGMTSTIKQVCDDPEICKKFRCRAWVKLMHPFNLCEFIRSLLTQFYTNCCSQHGSTVDFVKPMEMALVTEDVLIKKFTKQVTDERYLVILEDVSTMDDWDTIRGYLPDNNNGSCIIVHTQQLEVACLSIGHSFRVSELKRFSEDHSVCVFFKEDRENGEVTTKEKAAHEWLGKFQCVTGRQTDLWELYSMVVLSPGITVVPVWGFAGVGKLFLVKHVYCKEVVEQVTFEKFGWVNVSNPLDLNDLSRGLLLDLQYGSIQHGGMLRIKDPIQECRELLHERNCLVVIDGLQSTEEWDMTKAILPFGHSGSRIIVITNEESVATYCATPSTALWNVKGLESDKAIDLFKKKVSEKQTGSADLSPSVIEQAEDVLHKCGGLPKVIIAIAEFVASRLNASEDWCVLTDSFMHLLESHPAFDNLRVLFAWVHSYFRSCPDFLKPCIFYLSIFPGNHSIRRRRLLRRWIAEGYCRDTKLCTRDETAEEFFLKLVKLSMIQLPEATTAMAFLQMKIPFCDVNGFFREYIMSRSMEENLVFALEGSCSMNSQRTGRHLTIQRNWDRDRNVFDSIDFSRLRSLTVFGEWRSFFISDKMPLLRVLDLEDASGVTDGDLEEMVKQLPRLKFFSLRGCRTITRLPDSLGGLGQLQTLDVRNTSIVTLPSAIIKLKKLQYIRAGTTIPSGDGDMVSSPAAEDPSGSQTAGDLPPKDSSAPPPRSRLLSPVCCLSKSKICRHRSLVADNAGGVGVPRGIGKLLALHTLGVVNIESTAHGKAIVEELKNHSQLQKLGVSGINRNNSQEFFSSISGHAHLESLTVQLDNDRQVGCLDDVSRLPEKLQSLKLYGGNLPVWIKLLQNLRKLNLQVNTLAQEEIDALGNLRNLSILCLCFKDFQGDVLQFRTYFHLLRILEIAGRCRSLLAVKFHSGVLCYLEVLKIRRSSVLLSSPFSGLEHLCNLKEVSLTGSYDEELKQHLQSLLDKHPNEIKPVLKLEEPRSF